MHYKTILVHCDASKMVRRQLDMAAGLTERFGAYLVGMHARRPFETPNYIDIGVPVAPLFEAYEDKVDAEQAEAEKAFDKAIRGRNLRSEWRVVEGYPGDELVVNARYADLLVVGQADRSTVTTTPRDLPEVVAMATGRPVLVVPNRGAARPPGKVVMLCWNASRESARAAADALPFLRAADEVIVLIVDPHSVDGHGADPGADVATWLVRQGVRVTVQREIAGDAEVGDVILSRAVDRGVDMIVMGVYGHSRLREMMLGGVSRYLLAESTLPLLLSH